MIRLFFLFCFFFSSPLSALEWNQEKYTFPEEDSHWLSQVQPDSEEFSTISMAAQRRVLKRIIEEKKQSFTQLVEKAGKIILTQNSRIVDKEYLKEWHQVFTSSEQAWLKQWDLEGKAHWYAAGSLGGNSFDCSCSYFMIKLIDQRMENIRSYWWYKENEKYLSSK